MPRKKEYGREDFLNKAMVLFWDKGYLGTSMQDLVTETGLNKRSMYDEFGNKSQLFTKVIHHYYDNYTTQKTLPLRQNPLGLDNIENFFRSFQHEDNQMGCLIINSVLEKKQLPPEATQKITNILQSIEDLFLENIEAAKQNKLLTCDIPCKSLAQFLSTLLHGLFVQFKLGAADKKPLNINSFLPSILNSTKFIAKSTHLHDA